ncbi:MAG TPA: EAL domain-containing protein [Mycobacteriales bacterium]|nr:EAL domain-containing protein [Mycobacteriales bacterium]
MTDDAVLLARLLADESAFFARFQPIVDLSTDRCVGRMSSLHAHTADGEMAPLDIFLAAPDDATAARLDLLGRTTAIRDAAGWIGDQLLFVRLLGEVLSSPVDALEGMVDAAAAAGLGMRQLVVEVQLANGRDLLGHLARVVTRCRGAGLPVAVAYADDAEDVHDTISMLAPDYIKLDRSLVYARADDAAAVVDAAHKVGAKVVAFGLESSAQVDAARSRGADWGQGWHFGRPELPPTADIAS